MVRSRILSLCGYWHLRDASSIGDAATRNLAKKVLARFAISFVHMHSHEVQHPELLGLFLLCLRWGILPKIRAVSC